MATTIGSLRVVLTANAATAVRELRRFSVSVSDTAAIAQNRVAAIENSLNGLSLAIGASLGIGIAKIGADFDKQLTAVRAVSKETEAQFESTRQAVLALARDIGVPAAEAAAGLNDIVQAGFNTADALKVLEAALKGSRAGLVQTAVASNVLVGTLNAFQISAEESEETMGKLIRAVDLGVFTFDDLAQNLGEVTPVAAAFGVTLDEVLALLATLTTNGLKAAEATTQIRAVINSLIGATDKQQESIEKVLGSTLRASIAARGFGETLRLLVEASDRGDIALNNLFSDIRALSGAAALTGGRFANFDRILDDVRGSSDALGKTLNIQQRSLAALANSVKSEFFNAFTKFFEDNRTTIIAVADALVEFLRENRELVVGLTAAVVALSALAAALLVIKGVMAGLVVLIGGVSTVFGFFATSATAAAVATGAFATSLVALAAPLALIAVTAAAFIGLGYAIRRFLIDGGQASEVMDDIVEKLEDANKELDRSSKQRFKDYIKATSDAVDEGENLVKLNEDLAAAAADLAAGNTLAAKTVRDLQNQIKALGGNDDVLFSLRNRIDVIDNRVKALNANLVAAGKAPLSLADALIALDIGVTLEQYRELVRTTEELERAARRSAEATKGFRIEQALLADAITDIGVKLQQQSEQIDAIGDKRFDAAKSSLQKELEELDSELAQLNEARERIQRDIDQIKSLGGADTPEGAALLDELGERLNRIAEIEAENRRQRKKAEIDAEREALDEIEDLQAESLRNRGRADEAAEQEATLRHRRRLREIDEESDLSEDTKARLRQATDEAYRSEIDAIRKAAAERKKSGEDTARQLIKDKERSLELARQTGAVRDEIRLRGELLDLYRSINDTAAEQRLLEEAQTRSVAERVDLLKEQLRSLERVGGKFGTGEVADLSRDAQRDIIGASDLAGTRDAARKRFAESADPDTINKIVDAIRTALELEAQDLVEQRKRAIEKGDKAEVERIDRQLRELAERYRIITDEAKRAVEEITKTQEAQRELAEIERRRREAEAEGIKRPPTGNEPVSSATTPGRPDQDTIIPPPAEQPAPVERPAVEPPPDEAKPKAPTVDELLDEKERRDAEAAPKIPPQPDQGTIRDTAPPPGSLDEFIDGLLREAEDRKTPEPPIPSPTRTTVPAGPGVAPGAEDFVGPVASGDPNDPLGVSGVAGAVGSLDTSVGGLDTAIRANLSAITDGFTVIVTRIDELSATVAGHSDELRALSSRRENDRIANRSGGR